MGRDISFNALQTMLFMIFQRSDKIAQIVTIKYIVGSASEFRK